VLRGGATTRLALRALDGGAGANAAARAGGDLRTRQARGRRATGVPSAVAGPVGTAPAPSPSRAAACRNGTGTKGWLIWRVRAMGVGSGRVGAGRMDAPRWALGASAGAWWVGAWWLCVVCGAHAACRGGAGPGFTPAETWNGRVLGVVGHHVI